MTVKVIGLKRLAFGVAAATVATAVALPVFAGNASAQVSSRYVKMSNSKGAATGVSYEVGFTVPTTGTVQGVVVDFCSNTPIIGDSCTAPTGFSVGTPTVATSGGTNTGLSGTWTAASANTGRTLTLTNGTGGSISAATPVVFTLSTATNPNADNTTFYARIFTFAASANVATWTGTANGSATANVVDSGGVALSTAAQINLTAKVQETLTFCVYTGVACVNGGTAVALGDTNGVLRTSGSFVDVTTSYDIATNAASGAVVRFKAGLPTSGANTLATIGTSATAVDALTSTTQFGLCTYEATGTGYTPAAPYNNAACNTTTQSAGTGTTGGEGTAQFAFDTAAAAATYGDDLGTKVAGDTSKGKIAYAANVSTTQPAGIYTNTFTFIATGTY
jgi:hypothetical protein